jgi:hypothetical protein
MNSSIENYALHLKFSCTPKELHDRFGEIYPDEAIMDEWKLSENDYFTAINIAYFTPENIVARMH